MRKVIYTIIAFTFLQMGNFTHAEDASISRSNYLETNDKTKGMNMQKVDVIRDSIKLKHIATYEGFRSPTGIAIDSIGQIYVSNWSAGTVSQVDTQGKMTVFADGMSSPAGLDFDQQGNLYIADYSKNVIYRVTPTGQKTIFATGLHTPTGISFNRSGDLLVANRSSNEIVSIDPKGVIRAVAKGMRTPVGVVESGDGSLYVTNYGGGIIRIDTNGEVNTFSSAFGRPGVGIDTTTNDLILVVDNGDGNVRLLKPDGTTEVIVDHIGGSVALRVHEDRLYVGGWDKGAVYIYSLVD